jgi:DnaJ-class molecular chaperone
MAAEVKPCPRCGTIVAVDDNYCRKCGLPLMEGGQHGATEVYATATCTVCGGDGTDFSADCAGCDGGGFLLTSSTAVRCVHCQGRGKEFSEPCRWCLGRGVQGSVFTIRGDWRPHAALTASSCGYCGGDGVDFGDPCPACAGRGQVQVATPVHRCPRCGGDGRDFSHLCRICDGTGWSFNAPL